MWCTVFDWRNSEFHAGLQATPLSSQALDQTIMWCTVFDCGIESSTLGFKPRLSPHKLSIRSSCGVLCLTGGIKSSTLGFKPRLFPQQLSPWPPRGTVNSEDSVRKQQLLTASCGFSHDCISVFVCDAQNSPVKAHEERFQENRKGSTQ